MVTIGKIIAGSMLLAMIGVLESYMVQWENRKCIWNVCWLEDFIGVRYWGEQIAYKCESIRMVHKDTVWGSARWSQLLKNDSFRMCELE
jgi:hypothetical protein